MIRTTQGTAIIPSNLWYTIDQIEIAIHAYRRALPAYEPGSAERITLADLIDAFENLRDRYYQEEAAEHSEKKAKERKATP